LATFVAAALATVVAAFVTAAVDAAWGQLQDAAAGLGEYRHGNGSRDIIVTHSLILQKKYYVSNGHSSTFVFPPNYFSQFLLFI
jgi:hypothetical protein